MNRVLNSTALLILMLVSAAASAQYNLVHFDMQETCIADSVINRLYEDIASGGASRVGQTGQQMGVDVTDGIGLSSKSQQSVEDLLSVIDFFGELGWNAAGTSEPMLLLSNLADSTCDGMNAWYMNVEDSAHIMAIYYGHEDSPDSMAKDYDFASHEYGHGFFGRHQRARSHEISALNESVSDMFGAAYKAWMTTGKSMDTLTARQDSYLVGEFWAEVMRDYFGYDVDIMRDMANPAVAGDPDYYTRETARNTPIHSLGGVSNLAFVLMSQGGSHPRGASSIEVQGIGIKKAIEIVYYAFFHRIPFNNMPEFGDAVRKAAIRMHGPESVEYRSVDMAFQAVGLNNGLPAAELQQPQEEAEESQREEAQPEPEVVQEETAEIEVADETQQEETAAQPAISISGPTFMVILLAAIFAGSMCMVWLGRNQSKTANAADEMIVDHSGEGMLDIEKRNRAAQADTGAEPKQEPSQATEVFRPAKVKTNLAAILTVAGQRFELSLDSEPLELGRSAELNLPGALKAVLAEQAHISRRHCAIWYKSSTGELYLESRSDNVLQLAGQNIAPHSKAKIDFDQPIEITLATLIITLEPIS